jgi:hypothetical protein
MASSIARLGLIEPMMNPTLLCSMPRLPSVRASRHGNTRSGLVHLPHIASMAVEAVSDTTAHRTLRQSVSVNDSFGKIGIA